MTRDRRLVRRGSIAGLTVLTAALIATEQWDADRSQRFVVVSAILLPVLAVHVTAALELTSRPARVAPVTLVAAVVSAVAASAAWLGWQLSRSGFPDRFGSALVAVEIAAVVAGAVAAVQTWDIAHTVLATLWAGALSSFLLFAGSLLTFTFVASSVPNTQGRVMLPSATAAQRLAENRIEAPDGYLGLLALTCVLALLVCVAVPISRRAAHVQPARSS